MLDIEQFVIVYDTERNLSTTGSDCIQIISIDRVWRHRVQAPSADTSHPLSGGEDSLEFAAA